MLYLVYAVQCVNSWSWYGEREGWHDFIFLGDGTVEDEKERDESRWANHHEKLRLMRNSWASTCTMPDMVVTSTDPAGQTTCTRRSKQMWSWHTCDFAYLLVSSISCPSSYPISHSHPQLDNYRKNTKFSHPSPSLHAIVMSWHWV